MRIYAIGDLHLPGGQEKPMEVFGAHWENHFEKIRADWESRVEENDVVLLPGDTSWAMSMEDAKDDIARIMALPGRKMLLRGNHDYWWSSLTRVRMLLPEGNRAIQNDAFDLGDFVVCGSRGWLLVSENAGESQDKKVFEREKIRLELSLQDAEKKAQGKPIVCMMHYPPFLSGEGDTDFTRLLEKYRVKLCVYGHLHSDGVKMGFNGERNGIQYRLVSCDALDFRLLDVTDCVIE